MPTFFTKKTLAFLRALERNNDREWFKARRNEFERDVRGPMVSLIEQLALELPSFAPDLVCSPRESMFRQYRDTRFSEDKSPLKTNIAAVFPFRALSKGEGAGLYFQIDRREVWIGGGMYHPPTATLQAVREHLAGNFIRFRAIVESPSFKRRVGRIQGDRLQRIPRGFSADHPAAEYLKFRDLVAIKTFPAAFAASPKLWPTLVAIFKDVAPLVRFLNEPLTAPRAKARGLPTMQ